MGGGMYLASRVTFTPENTVIADNTHRYGSAQPVPDDCLGTMFSLGYNLIEEHASCAITGIPLGNITDQDPQLGPLQDNGGSTQTQALLAGSPASNAGEEPVCTDNNAAAITTDQRGVHRPIGGACDIGAYEQTTLVTIYSGGAGDGWVLENKETGNTGGTLNSAAVTLRLGDDAARRQYRSILSFNTGAALPDTAVITSLTLKVRRQSSTGSGNPLVAFKGFMLDVRKGTFGLPSLQLGDFKTAANLSVGPFTPAPVGGWYTIDLGIAAADINKLSTGSGLTQIRLRFKLDDNNNAVANILSLYSGNAPLASRPQLIISYYVP